MSMNDVDFERFQTMQRDLYKKLRHSGATHLQSILVCFAHGLTPFELASLFADPNVKPDSIRRKADRIVDDLASFDCLQFKNGHFYLSGVWTCVSYINNNNKQTDNSSLDFNHSQSFSQTQNQTQISPTLKQEQECKELRNSRNQVQDTDIRIVSSADNSDQDTPTEPESDFTPEMLDDAAFLFASLSDQHSYVTPEYALSVIMGIRNLKYTYHSKYVRIAVSQAVSTEIHKTVGDYIIGTVRTIHKNYQLITGGLAESVKQRSAVVAAPAVKEAPRHSAKPEPTHIETVGKDVTEVFRKHFDNHMMSRFTPRDGYYGTLKLGKCKIFHENDGVVIYSYLYAEDDTHDRHWSNKTRREAITMSLLQMGLPLQYRIENRAKHIAERDRQIQAKQKTPAFYAEASVSAV